MMNEDNINLFCPSETMRHELVNLFKYTDFAGIDAGAIVDTMKKEGLLPAADRRRGKQALAAFKAEILKRVLD